MKKVFVLVWIAGILAILLLPGCSRGTGLTQTQGGITGMETKGESNSKNYVSESEWLSTHTIYKRDDFSSIVVGKSTLWDLLNIAPELTTSFTSYGELYKIPIEGGMYMYIKIYMPNYVVGNISIVNDVNEQY